MRKLLSKIVVAIGIAMLLFGIVNLYAAMSCRVTPFAWEYYLKDTFDIWIRGLISCAAGLLAWRLAERQLKLLGLQEARALEPMPQGELTGYWRDPMSKQ